MTFRLSCGGQAAFLFGRGGFYCDPIMLGEERAQRDILGESCDKNDLEEIHINEEKNCFSNNSE